MASGRHPKQRAIFQSEEPVTALGFLDDVKQTLLYIVTTNRIMTYVTSGKGHGAPARLLDSLGSALGCVVFKENGEMIVGRDDAIYVYNGEAKSTVYAYEGNSPTVPHQSPLRGGRSC
jgi:vacuolar protein sorting-associated protein 11